MPFADDFSFDLTTGNLRHVSGTDRYPVSEIHQYFKNLVYQASKSGDDDLDITDLFVPSKRNSDTDIELNGNVNVDANAVQFLYGGSITQDNGDTRWSGLAISGSFPDLLTAPEVIQDNAKLTSYWGQSLSPDPALGYAVRILVLSRIGGNDIDDGRVRVFSRGYGFSYAEASTVLGRNESVAGVGTVVQDTFNQTPLATVQTFTDITNTEGFQQIDLNNGNGPQNYLSQWDRASRSASDLYEYIKFSTRSGSEEVLYGLSGELFRGVTHSIDYDNETNGPFSEALPLTFGNGATAQVLAVEDNGTTGTLYVQLLTGLAPADNDTITQASVTASVNGAPVSRELSTGSAFGQYFGNWRGSYGVGFDPNDLTTNDSLLTLDDTEQSPPNNQPIVVGNAIAGETRIILGKNNGSGSLDKQEFQLAAGNDSGNTTIELQSAVGSSPSSGTIRIDNGVGEDVYQYTSFNGTTVNLSSPLTATYAAGTDTYIPWLDEVASGSTLSTAVIYNGDIDLVGQAVDGGPTPTIAFPIAGTFSSSGFSVNIVNTPDA